MTGDPRLVIDGVNVRFGGVPALADVSLAVAPGSVTGLIGPNGAGKTTLFNVVTGLQAPTGGRVALDGRDITRLGPHRRARLGIGRTFQRLELFTDLTVRENLCVAGEIRATWRWSERGRGHVGHEVTRTLDLLGLGPVAEAEVGEVPTGTARLVELGRALMTRPRVLLLDEPASGQTEAETAAFGRLLRSLTRDHQLTVLLVEHDMALVMDVCDEVHVLDFGRLIASGTPDAVQQDPRVRDAYLGTVPS